MVATIDPEAVTKNLGAMLTTAAGLGYACGFLVVRARAHALGTDPGFVLLDQNYVFAGFRFALITLFVLLVAAPGLLLIAAAGSLVARFGSRRIRHSLEWAAAVGLGVLTVTGFYLTLRVQNVLLEPSIAICRTALADAAIDDSNNLGVLVILVATMVAACSILWMRARAGHVQLDNLTRLLGVIVALNLLLLPILHGTFVTDRKAYRLAGVPEKLADVDPPLWLIDRGADDRVILLAHAKNGRVELIPIKADKLDGIGTVEVTSLGKIVGDGELPGCGH
jgi:hypothetical protein